MNRRIVFGTAAALLIGAALLCMRLLSEDSGESDRTAAAAETATPRSVDAEINPDPPSKDSARDEAAGTRPAVARESFREAAPDTATIRGLVVDAFDLPISAAEVWIEADGRTSTEERTKTSDDGVFRLKTARRRTVLAVRAGAKGRTSARKFVICRTGTDPEEIVIRLADACSVTGRVIDEAGLPVGRAEVALTALDEDQHYSALQRTTTDADGRFLLDAAPFGACSLRAEIAGRFPVQVELYLRGDTERNIVLPSSAAGSVVLELEFVGYDASIGPALTVEVSAYAAGHPQAVPVAAGVSGASPDSAGLWKSPPLEDLRYSLVPAAAGYEFMPPVVMRNVGQPASRVRVKAVREATIELKGGLVDAAGKPLAGIVVGVKALNGAHEAEAVTEDDGTFLVRSSLKVGAPCYVALDSAVYVLAQPKEEQAAVARAVATSSTAAGDPRDRTRYLTTADPTKAWTLRAVASAAVVGVVRTDSGAPIRSATVRLVESLEGGGVAHLADARTDMSGRFAFRRLRATSAEMRVALGLDPASPTSAPFRTTEAETTETVLYAPAPGRVEGRITSDDEPLPGARVRIRRYSAATRSFADRWFVERIADRRGRFRFSDVPPGDYIFTAGTGVQLSELPHGSAFVVAPEGIVVRDIALE